MSREELGIPANGTVFISGANCFKILPELMRTWATVLERTPGSSLVLYPFGPAWGNIYPRAAMTGMYRRALSENRVDPRRLVVLDSMPDRACIDALNRMADVYLDAVPYNGATSLLDPLRAGIPMAVADGGALRFAQGAAMLRELGVPEMVAIGEDEYVQLAVRLGRDASLRQALRCRIRERMSLTPDFLNPALYGRRVSRALQRLFRDDSPHAPSPAGTRPDGAAPSANPVPRA